jgi:hypothetical protein
MILARSLADPRTKRAYFISDHGKKLSVFVGRGRGCHDRVLYSVVKLDGFSELELYETFGSCIEVEPQ